ncbi:ATP-binding protein [Desulfogranum marinum]|uniref:sensor histidine kinase n=1 Tax=Desulfogranum marinum TaxID=453220 RepID=UPI0029C7A45C|nr:ATP-binding protein [Desulfogranum marinum]
MKNLKISFGFISFFLALVSMLLANGLVLLFWYKDAIVRETGSVEKQLESVAALYQANTFVGLDSVKRALVHIGENAHAECIYIKQEQPIWIRENPMCKKSLEGITTEAASRKGLVGRITPVQAPFWSSDKWFSVATSITAQGAEPIFVALATPLRPVTQELFAKEKIIVVYLLVNALVLAVLLFFRLSKTILRPLDKLVGLADAYKGDGQYELLNTGNSNEFVQLSRSMQAMLERIETDRQALRSTIEQLEVANQELRTGRREMVQAEKMAVTGRLAAGLAHEIGNPLGIIGGYLELIKKSDVPSAEKIEFIDRAEGELTRLHGLVKQLVDCGRPALGGKEFFHAQPIVEGVVETLRYGKGNKDIELVVEWNAVDDEIEARIDGLKQVLLNCLLNAVDAVKERHGKNGGRVTILSKNRKSDKADLLVLQIIDNGSGIPTEQLDCIFDPFFTTKSPGSGTGLGLTVSRSIMESFGGELACTSSDSKGTIMELSLPLAIHGDELV